MPAGAIPRSALRHRRRAAAGAAAPADPLGCHHPQPAQGRPAGLRVRRSRDRIAALREQESLEAVRPDLDGAQIMALLGLKPGPVVGRAYRFLLEERMEHGPLSRGRRGQAARLVGRTSPKQYLPSGTGTQSQPPASNLPV